MWVVRTSEKRYPNGRTVAAEHKGGHENTVPSCELAGILSTEELDIMTKMAELISAHAMPDAVAAVGLRTEEGTQAPVLITEQEVLFSTATAVRARPAKTRRGFFAVLRGTFVNSTATAERPRRDYPPRRNIVMEHAAMAREMHRL